MCIFGKIFTRISSKLLLLVHTYICTRFAVHISASCLDAQSGAFSCRVDEFLKPQSCLYFNGHKLATNKKGKNPAYFHCVVLLTSPHGGLEATEVVHGWLNKWTEHSKLHKIKREGLNFINESKTQHLSNCSFESHVLLFNTWYKSHPFPSRSI